MEYFMLSLLARSVFEQRPVPVDTSGDPNVNITTIVVFARNVHPRMCINAIAERPIACQIIKSLR